MLIGWRSVRVVHKRCHRCSEWLQGTSDDAREGLLVNWRAWALGMGHKNSTGDLQITQIRAARGVVSWCMKGWM